MPWSTKPRWELKKEKKEMVSKLSKEGSRREGGRRRTSRYCLVAVGTARGDKGGKTALIIANVICGCNVVYTRDIVVSNLYNQVLTFGGQSTVVYSLAECFGSVLGLGIGEGRIVIGYIIGGVLCSIGAATVVLKEGGGGSNTP